MLARQDAAWSRAERLERNAGEAVFYLDLDSDDRQSHDDAPGGPDGLGDRRLRVVFDQPAATWRRPTPPVGDLVTAARFNGLLSRALRTPDTTLFFIGRRREPAAPLAGPVALPPSGRPSPAPRSAP